MRADGKRDEERPAEPSGHVGPAAPASGRRGPTPHERADSSRAAFQAHRSGSTRVFVVHDEDLNALGFYALSAGSVSPEKAPPRVRKGLGAHPIPVALITRLGVAKQAQGRGLGQAMLKDALIRIDEASELLGVRAVLAHAKDEHAKSFCDHFGFEQSVVHPLWMFCS